MAFYTADWVKRLVKEDHKALIEHIKKKDNDFRSYIDSTLPFTLYLDINNIRANVLQPNSKFIEGLTAALNLSDGQMLIRELDKAYQKTINYYIDSYESISSQDLAAKLNDLRTAIEQGNIKAALQKIFKNTYVIGNLSKRNKSVLILSPKFTTIQSKFGSVVKENFDYDQFSDVIDDVLQDSPRNIIKKYLNKNFSVLQNLGHVEVDVISSTTGSTEVKRGLVSPRLLQALVDWPADAKPGLLARQFSRETGQAITRIKVRKKFASTKLVLEMLIEGGIMIGTPESQAENLAKAPKERAFAIGQNLTSRILKDPRIITDLETSKSIKTFLSESVMQGIRTGKDSKYDSTTQIPVITPVSKLKLDVKQKPETKSASLPTIRGAPKNTPSLISLQGLLNAKLQESIKQNMGTGSRRDVLNYRSGRFAQSAQVEKLTVSREGMITAFYTYMKYPYATFSEGGRQQYPRSRDPKLLIARSIREIAGKAVANRLRAVVI